MSGEAGKGLRYAGTERNMRKFRENAGNIDWRTKKEVSAALEKVALASENLLTAIALDYDVIHAAYKLREELDGRFDRIADQDTGVG